MMDLARKNDQKISKQMLVYGKLSPCKPSSPFKDCVMSSLKVVEMKDANWERNAFDRH